VFTSFQTRHIAVVLAAAKEHAVTTVFLFVDCQMPYVRYRLLFLSPEKRDFLNYYFNRW
jgi:hypothetical protein